jgi:hypothetical protein
MSDNELRILILAALTFSTGTVLASRWADLFRDWRSHN